MNLNYLETEPGVLQARSRTALQGLTDTAKKSGGWGDLGNMKVHKSALERAKEAADPLPRQAAK